MRGAENRKSKPKGASFRSNNGFPPNVTLRAPAILRGIQKSGENVPKMSRGPFSDAARKMSRKCFENVEKMSGAQKNVQKTLEKCQKNVPGHLKNILKPF